MVNIEVTNWYFEDFFYHVRFCYDA